MNTQTRLSFPHWLARLTEYLPHAFIDGRIAILSMLYDDGATVAVAATYCRAYVHAPQLAPVETFALRPITSFNPDKLTLPPVTPGEWGGKQDRV